MATAFVTRADLRPPRSRRRGALDGWTLFTLAVAAAVATPVLVVASFVLVPSGEVWDHLAATVLPRYLRNSVLLILGVGAGVLVGGVGAAWLGAGGRFPGPRRFAGALPLPV